MPETTQQAELESLAPQYRPEYHQEYVELIDDALEQGYKNIALSGVYGSGKSSILDKVYEDHAKNAIRISLSPLASDIGKEPVDHKSVADETSEDNQNTQDDQNTESQNPKKKDSKWAVDGMTNLVQKEIVKQILYSVSPDKTPLSRFHRINPMSNLSRALFSIVGALLVFGIFVITEWNSSVKAWVTGFPVWERAVSGFLAVCVCAGIVWLASWLLSGKVRLKSLSAGGTAVALSDGDKSDTYFDKYLDEIVYFFAAAEKTIVIFEDLDRFNNPRIFDSLRELNNILNNGPDGADRTIQFIYAIKDSVFSNQLANGGQDEVPFARTKFFDIIIPVVPFMSHENAARIASDDFKGTDIDTDVFNVAGQYIPDKRILTNIRNEYLVYHKILNRNHEFEEAGFKDSRLLAFIIYKNTYLDDTNLLPSGGSNLDYIYNASRTIINHNIGKLNQQIYDNLKTLKQHTTQKEEYSNSLGEELYTYVIGMFGYSQCQSFQVKIGNSGQSYNRAGLKNSRFWEVVQNVPDTTIVYISLTAITGYYNTVSENIHYTKSQLVDIMHQPINLKFRQEQEIKRINDDSESCKKRIEQLRGYDFADLIAGGDTYCAQFNDFGKPDPSCISRSLKVFVQKLYDSDGLPMALLSHGWINRNYIQYSTIFDIKLTLPARDFIYHHVDSNDPDYGFKLSGEDAEAVVEEISQRGKFLFEEPRLLNFDILGHLADRQDRKTTELFGVQIAYLSKLEPTSWKFLAEYLNAEDVHNQNKVVQAITPSCPNILKFLAEEEFEEDRRLQYMNDALLNLSKDIDYASENETKNAIRNFLSEHIDSSAYDDDSLSAEQAGCLVKLGSEIGLHVDSLQDLSTALVDDFIKLGLYKYTRENICKASNSKTALLPINEMRVRAQRDDAKETGANHVYQYTLDNLDDFLGFLEENEPSIQTDEDDVILGVLQDVCAENIENKVIDTLLQHAADNVTVCNVAETDENGQPHLSEERWSRFVLPLLLNDRMLPTFRNIEACIREFSQSEGPAATEKNNTEDPEKVLKDFLLRQDKITDIGEASDDAKREVAAWVINTAAPYSRTLNLIHDVLGATANPKLIPNQINLERMQDPNDYAELMQAGIIPDDSSSWNYIADKDSSFKKQYIEHSQNFVTYMQDVLDADELCTVLTLKIGNRKPAEEIWDHPKKYLSGSSPNRLYPACYEALYQFGMHSLSYEDLNWIREQGKFEPAEFIQLIIPSLESLELPQVLKLLHLCGGDYAHLVNPQDGIKIIKLPDIPASHALYQYFHVKRPNGTPMLELAKQQRKNALCVRRKRPTEWKIS